MTEKLLPLLKKKLNGLMLVPSDGGRFEVSIDGKLVFSKLEEGRFPEFEEIKKHLPV
ncbi:MAG: SelT/SelW/SelH family protein [Candidatus Latescibacteria bacterium]|nr:SelT/SelW/SelH family protein [Candidatus Latescibacterota bacterium]